MDGFRSGYWCCYRSRDGSIAQTNGGYHVFEQFVEDGNLIRWTCFYGSKGELVLSEWDSFSIGDKGVLRTMIWKLPKLNIKIKRIMRTLREDVVMDTTNQNWSGSPTDMYQEQVGWGS